MAIKRSKLTSDENSAATYVIAAALSTRRDAASSLLFIILLLSSASMEALLRQLRVFDMVIVDTPPMGYFADTEVLIDNVDATMLVVRQDVTAACDINDAVDTLRAAKSRFLGCILNDMTSSVTEGQNYGYGYGYGSYGYGYGYGNYGYGAKSGGKKS